ITQKGRYPELHLPLHIHNPTSNPPKHQVQLSLILSGPSLLTLRKIGSRKRSKPDESDHSEASAPLQQPQQKKPFKPIVWDAPEPPKSSTPAPPLSLEARKELRAAKFGAQLDPLPPSAPQQRDQQQQQVPPVTSRSVGIKGAASNSAISVTANGFGGPASLGRGGGAIASRLGPRGGGHAGGSGIQSRLNGSEAGSASVVNAEKSLDSLAEDDVQMADSQGSEGSDPLRHHNQQGYNQQNTGGQWGRNNQNYGGRGGFQGNNQGGRGGWNQSQGYRQSNMNMSSGMQQLQNGIMGAGGPIVQQFGMDQFGNIIPLGPMNMGMMQGGSGRGGARGGLQQQGYGRGRGGYGNQRGSGYGNQQQGGWNSSYGGARPQSYQNQSFQPQPPQLAPVATADSSTTAGDTTDGPGPATSEAGDVEIILDNTAGAANPGSASAHPQPSTSAPAPTPCFYGNGCTRADCRFSHPWQLPQGAARQCRFWPNCLNAMCPFYHPGTTGAAKTDLSAVPCKFDAFCSKPGCPYKHTAKGAGGNMSVTFNKPTGATVDRLFAAEEAEKVLGESVVEPSASGEQEATSAAGGA
ncbi:hypothetical protein BC830DRAFT_1159312, partial [Chytriomyces sp. MP71]